MGGVPLRRVTSRVLLLATGHVAMAAVLTVLGWDAPAGPGDLRLVLMLTAAFAIVGVLPVHVELGRHATSVTLVDAALVVGLFLVRDARLVALAAMVGELLACAASRQAPLKVLFNVSATLGTVTLAARTFALLPSPDATQPATWALTLAAVAVYAISNHASTSAVLTVVTGRRFHDLFLEALVPAAAATAVSAGLGITVVVLFAASPLAPMLLLPLGVVAFASFRAVAAQRSESLRFRRLYEASSRTGSLRDISETLQVVADEARELVGGEVGVAAAPDATGTWIAVVVDDRSTTIADAATVDAIRAFAADGDREVTTLEAVPLRAAALAPGSRSVVVASASGEVSAIVVVFRSFTDEHHDARTAVLAAFAGHAALATTNARLFDEVEESLRREIDLNRQKDEFIASISHELRTPMTSILGSVVTLREHRDRLDIAQQDALQEIAERQAHRLKRLIEDLILVAAAANGAAQVRAEDVSIATLVADVGGTVPAPLQLTTMVATDAPEVVATDRARVRQILDALLDNAAKFAPGRAELRFEAAAVGGGLSVALCDHGPGIAVEDRPRVFERFVQLDQSATRHHGGTGTGLYLASQLAGLLGGALTVDSTPGGGATFELTLPAALVTRRPGTKAAAADRELLAVS